MSDTKSKNTNPPSEIGILKKKLKKKTKAANRQQKKSRKKNRY